MVKLHAMRDSETSLHFLNISRVLRHGTPLLALRGASLIEERPNQYSPAFSLVQEPEKPDPQIIRELHGFVPKRSFQSSVAVGKLLDYFYAVLMAYSLHKQKSPEDIHKLAVKGFESGNPAEIKDIGSHMKSTACALLRGLSPDFIRRSAMQFMSFLFSLETPYVRAGEFNDPVFEARLIYYKELCYDFSHALAIEQSQKTLVEILHIMGELSFVTNFSNYSDRMQMFAEQQRFLSRFNLMPFTDMIVPMLNMHGFFLFDGHDQANQVFLTSKDQNVHEEVGYYYGNGVHIHIPIQHLLWPHHSPKPKQKGIVSDLGDIVYRLFFRNPLLNSQEVYTSTPAGFKKTQTYVIPIN